jgi:hypothetical protein
MKRTITLISVFALMISMLALPATATSLVEPDQILDSTAASNQASYWQTLPGEICAKIDVGGSSNYVVPAPPADSTYTKIIVKQAQLDYVFLAPSVGDVLNTGGAYSHVIRCWKMAPPFEPNATLGVEKEADGEYDRNVTWTIDKSVDPDYHRLLVGGSAPSDYEVDVTKIDSGPVSYRVSGDIEISWSSGSDPAVPITITSILDSINGATLTGAGCNPTLATPTTIASGGKLECSYTAPGDPMVLSNTVTVSGYYVIPAGFIGAGTQVPVSNFDTATFDYDENLTGFGTVNVEDIFNFGRANQEAPVALGSTNTNRLFEYDKTFVCTERGTFTYPNRARIVETGQHDDALVTVECVVALEACTPGFWGGTSTSPYTPANQPAWDYLASEYGITPNTVFADGKTYNEIFNTRGRNNYSGSLIWHAAAAYLNATMAADGFLDFPLTQQEVLDLFGELDKDALAHANEDGQCPFGANFDFSLAD